MVVLHFSWLHGRNERTRDVETSEDCYICWNPPPWFSEVDRDLLYKVFVSLVKTGWLCHWTVACLCAKTCKRAIFNWCQTRWPDHSCSIQCYSASYGGQSGFDECKHCLHGAWCPWIDIGTIWSDVVFAIKSKVHVQRSDHSWPRPTSKRCCQEGSEGDFPSE